MTNEEAKQELVNLCYKCEYSYGTECMGDVACFEAKRTAIKALSQQTEDAISRQTAISDIHEMSEWHTGDAFNADRVMRHLKDLPSVTPKQRTGHWIEYTRVLIPEPINKWEQAWYCSECGYGNQECEDGSAWLEWKYCPNCGCRMFEPQESEVSE